MLHLPGVGIFFKQDAEVELSRSPRKVEDEALKLIGIRVIFFLKWQPGGRLPVSFLQE